MYCADNWWVQIIDEKSLIKKYQNEIRCLKEELEQLKRGIVSVPELVDIRGDDIVLLKQKVYFYWLGCIISDFYFLGQSIILAYVVAS